MGHPDLFRQAGKCHREGFFFHGKKDMADGAFFNADPAANDLVKRLVTVPQFIKLMRFLYPGVKLNCNFVYGYI